MIKTRKWFQGLENLWLESWKLPELDDRSHGDTVSKDTGDDTRRSLRCRRRLRFFFLLVTTYVFISDLVIKPDYLLQINPGQS